jgi:hypothetical protein
MVKNEFAPCVPSCLSDPRLVFSTNKKCTFFLLFFLLKKKKRKTLPNALFKIATLLNKKRKVWGVSG